MNESKGRYESRRSIRWAVVHFVILVCWLPTGFLLNSFYRPNPNIPNIQDFSMLNQIERVAIRFTFWFGFPALCFSWLVVWPRLFLKKEYPVVWHKLFILAGCVACVIVPAGGWLLLSAASGH